MNDINVDSKADNRQIIKEKALYLFYSKGYDAVGVQEIVNTAGITKPTLYYYFKSKSGLLQSILEEKCTSIIRDLKEAAFFDGDLVKTLERIVKVYMQVAVNDHEFYNFMFSLYFTAKGNESYQIIRPYIIKQFDIVKTIFDEASYQLGNMRNRQEQFAIGFIGIITHYIMYHYEKDYPVEELLDQQVAYSLVHQFMHGINS